MEGLDGWVSLGRYEWGMGLSDERTEQEQKHGSRRLVCLYAILGRKKSVDGDVTICWGFYGLGLPLPGGIVEHTLAWC